MSVLCGFPEITLDGNINDWILLKEKTKELLDNKVKQSFGKRWSVALLPILDEFINAFKGKISMIFWNSMIWRGQWAYIQGTIYYVGSERSPYYIRYNKFISGWINVFFPYLSSTGKNVNEWAFRPYEGDLYANKQYEGKEEWNDDEYGADPETHQEHTSREEVENTEEWKNALHRALGPHEWNFSESIVYAPVEAKFNGEDLYLHFTSGIVGYEQDKETLQLSPVVGWYIEETERPKENKIRYPNW